MIIKIVQIVIALFFTFSVSHAQTKDLVLDEVESIRMLNHNNLPVKVLVYYYDEIFVGDMFRIITEINQQEELAGTRHQIQFVTIGTHQPTPLFTNEILGYHRALDVTGDLWLQDWGEVMVAKSYGDDKERLFIFDTNRGRGLAYLPSFLAKIWNAEYHYKLSSKNGAGNYGGNLEVTPNNVLWIGSTTNGELRNLFIDNGYSNNHVILDTKWLSVGHVDEYLSQVILDESDPCGFAIVKADVELGFDLVRNASNSDFDELPNRSSNDRKMTNKLTLIADHLKSNNATELSSLAIRQNRLISSIIDRNLELLKEAIISKSPQCQDIKVISFPTLFDCRSSYENIEYRRSCVALLPGAANMLVLRNHQIIPDPFFPPFKNYIREALEESGQTPHFLDDRTYHYRNGEVHCGTNTMRLPNEYLNSSIR